MQVSCCYEQEMRGKDLYAENYASIVSVLQLVFSNNNYTCKLVNNIFKAGTQAISGVLKDTRGADIEAGVHLLLTRTNGKDGTYKSFVAFSREPGKLFISVL
jgi:hypothetical protein